MSHIFSAGAQGSSDKSLTAAIASAMATALKEATDTPLGDHQLNITLIVDGFVFDGKEWHVKITVMIADYTLEEEDLYHELEKERKEREEISEHLHLMFHASNHNTHELHDIDHEMYHLNDQIHHSEFGLTHDIRDIHVYGSQDVSNQLHNEYLASKPTVHHDYGAPGLDLGGGSGTQDKDAA